MLYSLLLSLVILRCWLQATLLFVVCCWLFVAVVVVVVVVVAVCCWLKSPLQQQWSYLLLLVQQTRNCPFIVECCVVASFIFCLLRCLASDSGCSSWSSKTPKTTLLFVIGLSFVLLLMALLFVCYRWSFSTTSSYRIATEVRQSASFSTNSNIN